MKRSLWSMGMLLWIASSGAGCNELRCGPGTKKVQDENGDVQCVETDAVAPLRCLSDGGAHIVGGNCVSTVSCGADTTAQIAPDGSTVCVGTGGGGDSCVPPCGTPQANSLCIDGQVRHLVDGSRLAPGEKVHVAVYEPLSFLGDPSTPPLAETDTDCGFKFDGVRYPSSMLVVVAVSDPGARGLLTVTNQLTGTGAQVIAQQAYRVDGYALPKSVVAGWSAAAGIDYGEKGAVVLRFFADPKPAPTQQAADETLPVAGVTLYQDGAPADGLAGHPTARYFGASLTALDASRTTTGTAGTAILAAPVVTGAFPIFTGMGGTSMGEPIDWEIGPGGSSAQVVFVERLHPM